LIVGVPGSEDPSGNAAYTDDQSHDPGDGQNAAGATLGLGDSRTEFCGGHEMFSFSPGDLPYILNADY
jgi:hypothetical protein